MAAVVQGKVKNYSVSTPTLPTGCFHSMNHTHFNLVHLYYLSHACTLVTQLTTDNVLYRTPEGTPIGLVHTHHITSSGIQLVLVDDKPSHISMSSYRLTHQMHLRQKQRSQSHLLGSQRKVIAFEMIVEVLAVLKFVRMVKDN